MVSRRTFSHQVLGFGDSGNDREERQTINDERRAKSAAQWGDGHTGDAAEGRRL